MCSYTVPIWTLLYLFITKGFYETIQHCCSHMGTYGGSNINVVWRTCHCQINIQLY
ncbi:hypothetical protein LINGRAHAP2_LOCUS16552 [Linum grandiflorum]